MKKGIIVLLILLANYHSNAQSFQIDTLLMSGPIQNRINYVILGDGYLEAQLPTFLDDAKKLTNELFGITPYKEYVNYYNVFCISVPSNEEGAADDPQDLIDNYFGSTFNYNGIERLLVPTNNTRIAQVLINNFPAYNHIFVLVNSNKYGGSGGWVASSSTNEQSSEIAIHELGHSFANLADEYWAGEQYAKEAVNMTQETSSQMIRWTHWLGDENIGIIPYSESTSWKKPHDRCKMQYLGSPFCAVCREQFTRVTHQLITAIDDYSPKTLKSIDDNMIFDISSVAPVPNTLKTTWLLNGQQIASNVNAVDIIKSKWKDGANVLRVNVYDSTTYDRRTTIFVNSVVWDISSEITSELSTTEVERGEHPGEIILDSEESARVERLMWSIFPNPTADKLKVEYLLYHAGNVRLSIHNEAGQLIESTSIQRHAGEYGHEIDLSGYDGGIYFLTFEANDFKQTLKVIKGL